LSESAPAVAAVAAAAILGSILSIPSAASADPEPGQGPAVSVVSEGDARFSVQLADGHLQLGLRDVTDTSATAWLDAGSAVLYLPEQDSDWGGKGKRGRSLTAWQTVSDEGSRFWTTNTSYRPEWVGSRMMVDFDAGLIAAAEVAADPEFSYGGIETNSGGYFVLFRNSDTPSVAWDSRSVSSNALTAATTQNGDGVTPTPDPIKKSLLTFSAEGVYYLTVTAAATTPDGERLTDSAVYTVVVGDDIDPATVAPAAQPDDGEADDGLTRDDGVTVFDAGDVRIAPTVTDGELGLKVADHTNPARAPVLDAEGTVFYLPKQDTEWAGESAPSAADQARWHLIVPRGTLAWRTPGHIQQLSSIYAANDLKLSLDGGLVGEEHGTSSLALQSFAGPGDFTSYKVNTINVPGSAPVWDSRDVLGSSTVQLHDLGPASNAADGGATGYRRASGWAFTQPGVYCVTLRAALGDQIAAGTFTVAVGADTDPRTVDVCAQEEAALPEDEDDGDQGTGDGLDPTVTYLDLGHTDLAVDVVDGHTAIGVDYEKFYDLEDTIWVGQRDTNEFTVPTVTSSRDYTFIGEPGTEFWGFTQGSNSTVSLWPGLSLMGIATGEIQAGSRGSITLLGVSGPGDVVIFADNAATRGTASDIYWSSKQGYTQSRSFERGNHSHMSWAFTGQGVYCLNWQATLRLPSGADSTATEQLTVVVGKDIDLAGVQPCGRDTETAPPVGAVVDPAALATETTVLRSGQALITPYLDGAGAVQVFARTQDSPASELANRDVESVVFTGSYKSTEGSYTEQRGWWSGWDSYAKPDISWDSSWLDPGEVSGDPTLALGAVEGPGDLMVTRQEWLGTVYIPKEDAIAFSTADEDKRETTLWDGWRERHILHSFAEPGVYCVPLTWTVSLAGGGSTSVSKTLTFAVGATNADLAEYIDPAGVSPCAEGGSATDPDPGDTPGEDDPGVGENPGEDTPASDVTVLRAGHVDIASLTEDGHLVTKIKDDTTGADEAIYRDTKDVIFYVEPLAATTVPESESGEYDFLGAAGSKIWLLPATQNELLLWPGWSTELIPREQLASDVDWRLTDVSGPGDFALFETGTFGVPIMRWNTRDGIGAADSFTIPPGVHAHGNWAFSAEGVYCLAFNRTATLTSGGTQTASSVLAVAVGDVDPRTVDPAACFAARPVTSVTVSAAADADPAITSPGGALQLVASVLPADADESSVRWEVISGTAATVSDSGLVTAVADGTSIIRASARDGSGVYGELAITITGQTTPVNPGDEPTDDPTDEPTEPTDEPSTEPTEPTDQPTDRPTEEPADTQSAPVDEADLTDAHRGGVDGPESARPGQRITVTVPGQAGVQVRIWLHSTPALLGTFTLDQSGRATVTIPAQASLGGHKIVVQALDGTLVGWTTIRLEAVGPDGPPTPPATGRATSGTGQLPITGPSGALPVLAGLALVLMLAGTAAASSNRRKAIRRGP
jgi:surface-anchored protein